MSVLTIQIAPIHWQNTIHNSANFPKTWGGGEPKATTKVTLRAINN